MVSHSHDIIDGIYVNKYICNDICELGTFQEVSFPFQIQRIDCSTFSHFLFFLLFPFSHDISLLDLPPPYILSFIFHLTLLLWISSCSYFFSHHINFSSHLLHHLLFVFLSLNSTMTSSTKLCCIGLILC